MIDRKEKEWIKEACEAPSWASGIADRMVEYKGTISKEIVRIGEAVTDKHPDNRILAVIPHGSMNYGSFLPTSDVDVFVLLAPSRQNVLSLSSPINSKIVMEGTGSIATCKDIRLFWGPYSPDKANTANLQLLCSPFSVIEPSIVGLFERAFSLCDSLALAAAPKASYVGLKHMERILKQCRELEAAFDSNIHEERVAARVEFGARVGTAMRLFDLAEYAYSPTLAEPFTSAIKLKKPLLEKVLALRTGEPLADTTFTEAIGEMERVVDEAVKTHESRLAMGDGCGMEDVRARRKARNLGLWHDRLIPVGNSETALASATAPKLLPCDLWHGEKPFHDLMGIAEEIAEEELRRLV